MSKTSIEATEVIVNGINYIRKDSISATPAGPRAVVVVDRGWIFAGDVTVQGGHLHLDRAVWVFRWESIGFDAMVANPKSDKVTLRKMSNQVMIPMGAEIFRIPVDNNWGL